MVSRVVLVGYRALSDLVGKGSFFFITVVAAHRLSREAFGLFALASTFGWMVGIATDFGTQLHVARAVATRSGHPSEILRSWLRVRVAASAAALGAVAVVVIAAPQLRSVAGPMLLFAAVYIASGLIEFLHYFYRGLGRSDLESSLTLGQRSATLVLALAVLAWRPNLTWLAAAMLAPVVVTLLFSARLAARLGAAQTGRPAGSDRRAPLHSLWPEFRRSVFPIGAGIMLSALYFRIDVFLVELWSGTESVALYNAVFRLVEALRLFPAAVLAVQLPALCQASDTAPLRRVSAGVTAFACAAAAVLWAGAGWGIPLLYGAQYAAAIGAFRILLLSFPLLSLNYALTHQLIGWNGQRAYAAICGVALVANVAMNAWLIPARSIEGAAWATFWTEVVLTSGCAFALWASGPPRTADAMLVTAAS